jgi:hypothetical protein
MKTVVSVFFAVCVWVNLSWAQWTPINNNLTNLKISGLALVGTTIYAGTTDGGIFSSTDNGDSWSTYSGNDTLPNLNINGLDGGLNDGAGMFIYTTNGMALLSPPTPLFVPPFIQTLANKDLTLYRQYQSPSRRRIVGTKSAGIFYTDNDTTWTEGTGIPAGTSKNIRGFTSEDIEVLAIAGTENGAFLSTNRGTSWTAANTGLTGDALKINNMFSIFALTSNGLYYTILTTFTGWTAAVPTGDFRTCASDLISGKYYFFGDNVGTSIDLNTSQIATLTLTGISGGVITSVLLYGTNIFVGTETGGVFRAPLSGLATGVHDRDELPNKIGLSQNYPNPFNPTTTISFILASKSYVSLRVFDALGREVSILVSKELTAGSYSQEWNAGSLPSGVYFYRLQAGNYSETRKLMLLK